MVEAIKVRSRYDYPDESGVTRRERNERFDTPSPLLIVPDIARHIWDRYFEISASLRRVQDGACNPIPPSEFLAWSKLTNVVLSSFEYETLREMDRAYCEVIDEELKDYRARQNEAMKAETEASRTRR